MKNILSLQTPMEKIVLSVRIEHIKNRNLKTTGKR